MLVSLPRWVMLLSDCIGVIWLLVSVFAVVCFLARCVCC